MSSPRHSGTAIIDRIWPPMIDSLDDSSSCAFAVSTAARSASTRRSTARLARTGSTPSARGSRPARCARHREREPILVALGAQQDRDVGRARQQLERRLDGRLDHLARLEPRAERLQRLVDAQRFGRLRPSIWSVTCGRSMIERDATSRSPRSSSRFLADAHRDAHRIGAVAEQQEVAVGERDLPARGRVDGMRLPSRSIGRAVRRAQDRGTRSARRPA